MLEVFLFFLQPTRNAWEDSCFKGRITARQCMPSSFSWRQPWCWPPISPKPSALAEAVRSAASPAIAADIQSPCSRPGTRTRRSARQTRSNRRRWAGIRPARARAPRLRQPRAPVSAASAACSAACSWAGSWGPCFSAAEWAQDSAGPGCWIFFCFSAWAGWPCASCEAAGLRTKPPGPRAGRTLPGRGEFRLDARASCRRRPNLPGRTGRA